MMWAYGLSMAAMMFVILKFIDWWTPKINIEKELLVEKNLAVAIPVAAVILGVAAIVVAVIVS